MTGIPQHKSTAPAGDTRTGPVARFLAATEIDTRLLGMVGALLLIWIGFHLYGAVFNGAGAFLTPRNLWNLSVQTSSIGIMATGMVLVIITLSGSIWIMYHLDHNMMHMMPDDARKMP